MRKYRVPSLSQELDRSRHFPHPHSKAGLLPLRVLRIRAPLHPTHFTLKLLQRFHTDGSSLKRSAVLEEGKQLYLIKGRLQHNSVPQKGIRAVPREHAPSSGHCRYRASCRKNLYLSVDEHCCCFQEPAGYQQQR